MLTSDEDLMANVQAGDHDAFSVLMSRYQQPLVRVAFSKVGQAAICEDLVQDCFLAVYRGRETFRPELRFRTWLWTILLNLCKRHYRRELCRGEREPVPEPILSATALRQLIRAEETALLHQALAQLPETQGDAVRLRFFAGLTFEDIAAATGCSESGARQRVKLGLAALANLLEPVQERP